MPHCVVSVLLAVSRTPDLQVASAHNGSISFTKASECLMTVLMDRVTLVAHCM